MDYFYNYLPTTSRAASLPALLLVALGLYLSVTTFLAWYRLRHFRGPVLASFSYLWLARASISGKAMKIHMAARDRYGGPLVRVAPDMLVTDDPEIHRHINGARAGYAKAEWYHAMRIDPYVHTMFSTCDTAYHDDVKARTAAGYAGRDVPSLESDVDEQIGGLKALIRRKYLSTPSSTRPIDFANAAQYFTLDSLAKIAFGREFGYLAADADFNGYIKLMEQTTAALALGADVEWIGKLLFSDFMLKLLGPKPTDHTGVGMMMGQVQFTW